jgi:hypothetical protein
MAIEYRPGDTLQAVENLACPDEKDESWQETREIDQNLQQLAKPHMRGEFDLLPSGYIWPYDLSCKLTANSHRI